MSRSPEVLFLIAAVRAEEPDTRWEIRGERGEEYLTDGAVRVRWIPGVWTGQFVVSWSGSIREFHDRGDYLRGPLAKARRTLARWSEVATPEEPVDARPGHRRGPSRIH
jgi:hypothetical protein